MLGMKKMAQFVRNEEEVQVMLEVGPQKKLWLREKEDSGEPAEIFKQSIVYVKFCNQNLNNYMTDLVQFAEFNSEKVYPKVCGPDSLQTLQEQPTGFCTVNLQFTKHLTSQQEPLFLGKFSMSSPPQKIAVKLNRNELLRITRNNNK